MAWTLHPHGPLVRLEENLAVVDGDTPGAPIPRRMTVVRLEDRSLVIHSAIALEEEEMAALEEFGQPAYLIVPNGFHRYDARFYFERYRQLTVIAPHESTRRVEKVVPVTGGFELLPNDPSLSVEVLRGGKVGEAVLIVSSKSNGETPRESLVFNDMIFNVEQTQRGGAMAAFLKLVGSIGPARVTNIAKMALVKNKGVLAEHLRELAARPNLARVIPAHGGIIDNEPGVVLKRIADQLAPAR